LDITTIVRHKSLLDTCKEIRSEATSIFWAENEFLVDIDQMRQAEDALLVAGKANCRSITCLMAQARLRAYAWESTALHNFEGITMFRVLAVELATMLYNSGVREEAVLMERKGLEEMSSLSARRLDNMIEQFHTTFLLMRYHAAHHCMTTEGLTRQRSKAKQVAETTDRPTARPAMNNHCPTARPATTTYCPTARPDKARRRAAALLDDQLGISMECKWDRKLFGTCDHQLEKSKETGRFHHERA